MRSIAFSVVAVTLVLTLANPSAGQSRLRFANKTSAASTKESARLTSQVGTDETATETVPSGSAEGYVPPESHTTITAGCAYSGMGGYGYNPDFGYGPNGMSVWPGVPACCDPWFGYCGEPRCFYECTCHQGTYQMFHCPKCKGGACGPELLKWQKGDWCATNWKPSAMCYGSKCNKCVTHCARCQPTSYEPGTPESPASPLDVPASDGPTVKPSPGGPSQPPRNAIPTMGPSARRRSGNSTT